MCEECWKDYGSPSHRSDAIDALAAMIREADSFGALYVVVGDWNVEDDCITPCKEDERCTDLDRAIVAAMEKMPLKDRASAMAYADDFVTVPIQGGTVPK